MNSGYVEQRNGGYTLAGTRISLDSVVYEFRRVAAPESILRSFPLIASLERVYGAIAYCLAHQEQIDGYLVDQAQRFEGQRSRQVCLRN